MIEPTGPSGTAVAGRPGPRRRPVKTVRPRAVRAVPVRTGPAPVGTATRVGAGAPGRTVTRVGAGPAQRRTQVGIAPAPARARAATPGRSRPTGLAASRHWPAGFVLLVAVMTALSLIGLVMVLSASSIESLRRYGSPWYYFERQVLWLALGGVAFGIAVRVDYRRWRRLAPFAAGGTILMLAAVLLPGVGISVSGSARWIGTGSWRLQPSELAKLALILFAADVLDRRADRVREWRYSMLPVLIVFTLMAALVMAQPDMGTTMVLACIMLAVLYVGGSPLRPLCGLLVTAVGLATLSAVAAPYRWRRMTAFIHPFADAGNAGYQSAQGLVALGSGRLFGLGVGATRASWGYLPNQHTDFIFAIIGEETGLLGSLLIVGLFVALAGAGIRVACRAPDRFGGILAAGITAWLVAQAVINIGAVVGLLPVTGVPLPFVSFGGSSLIFALGSFGVLCNVAKQSR